MMNGGNKLLTVGKLKEILNEVVNDENKNSVIFIDSNSLSGKGYIGGMTHTTVSGCGFGFDWDMGKFIIFPSEKLFYKDT